MNTTKEMRMDICIACGAYTPEGDLLCPLCLRKPENNATASIKKKNTSKVNRLLINLEAMIR